MQELQSRTKEQLQRYAQTYLEVDPRTVDVTFPWNRLFEVYVDVHDTPDVTIERNTRLSMKQRVLDNLERDVDTAQKALDDAKKQASAVPNGKIDPALETQLQEAIEAAQKRYDEELQTQRLEETEEKAQQNRTWAPTT